MKILAYDTSTDFLSIGIFEDDRRIDEENSAAFTRHSASLVASIEKIFKKNRMKPEDVDCLAVGLGPGSFTGLRVGITAAKILAYALNKKIVGVSSFEAIARGAAYFEGEFAVTADAKKGNLYAAVYRYDKSKLKTLVKPCLMKSDRLKNSLNTRTLNARDHTPLASRIAEIGVQMAKTKKFTDPFKLEPLYLYSKDCNVTKK